MEQKSTSKKFYELNMAERLSALGSEAELSDETLRALSGEDGLTAADADHMVENAIGTYALPLGIARNFVVNGRSVLVTMVIEEPSVIAGASFMAKLVRAGGGFTATADAPEMIGQMQILDVPDLERAAERLLSYKEELLHEAASIDPVLVRLGGGPRDLQVHQIASSPIGPFLVVHLIYDVRDAMGANTVNTALETLAPRVAAISGGRVHLRILSNLADHRLAKATCTVPLSELAFDHFSAESVRDGIIAAQAFAVADPYRAATHNKGIMNGVDAVVIATGNDWRAVEAGAHAYAARSGRYTSLSSWAKDKEGNLFGRLEMPMAVGIVGGATHVHPGAQAALKLMKVGSAAQLAEIIVSVGLAQNLAALRALATEGIQRGHMSLHARQVAIAAGASESQVNQLADQLVAEGTIRVDRAAEILEEWSQNPNGTPIQL
jgi:hydroxymethylglutaryl-CoA reductase